MKDKVVKILTFIAAVIILIICGGMVYSLVTGAVPAFEKFGVDFIFKKDWQYTPDNEQYGALPFIVGTLITAFLAVIISFPFSMAVSLFVGEYFKDTKVAAFLGTATELLAGIPSIVYGLWGFYVLRPIMVGMGLSEQGFGIMTSSVVLAIMIIPYAASLSSEFIRMVPNDIKEGAYSLGATKYEVVFHVILPAAASGISSSYILSLGRALGETMAVTMLIGNTNTLPTSLTDTANTMASIIANQFGEAAGLKLSALIAIGLLLFLITALINFIAKMIIKKYAI
ncbi:MAG: phosphate ABC transporter permease subunit PstC [Bacteroidales bacterium]|jgi:phosphate transport system permease protein|nr:phosphate ABC transporter permease subunit PstC [Bacteroidales bacterium]MDD2204879.1 phosphate ABC transporter permease subunit PstC [Bacteroidales bacterium]MDD3151532.1 phosphate ABC transporter permease subunit PstC [Bacteroidales bacterium]MDD3913535.1 phosphate ABC transporter permease subunit PstC [Bacteroidales bacterium]MDD4634154.1 phosphate ABC transporter permease subunit PstC [Bacteroidales bacterium]